MVLQVLQSGDSGTHKQNSPLFFEQSDSDSESEPEQFKGNSHS